MRALLERELLREHLSFPEWTALVFLNAAPLSVQQIAQRQLAGHVVAGESEAKASVAALISLGALSNTSEGLLRHSKSGRELFERLSKSVEQITSTLYGDLPQADLEATHRTLLEVAARTNKLLGAA
jgi:hypothetical protein